MDVDLDKVIEPNDVFKPHNVVGVVLGRAAVATGFGLSALDNLEALVEEHIRDRRI